VNWQNWLLWGFVSTVLLTTMEAGSQGLKLTRMNLPYLLGTMVTPDRDKAKLYGFFIHPDQWMDIFHCLCARIPSLGVANWWRGVLIGIAHALFVLVVVVALLPGLHPRMASERHGPEASRDLEPPGFMARNYGISTPVSVILSHAVFGAVLGAFYRIV